MFFSVEAVIGNLRSWHCNCRAEYHGGTTAHAQSMWSEVGEQKPTVFGVFVFFNTRKECSIVRGSRNTNTCWLAVLLEPREKCNVEV